MAELNDIANYAEIFGALLVIGGLAFAGYELRQSRLQRHREATFELFHTMQSREFVDAIGLMRRLPADLSADELERDFADAMPSIHLLLAQYENLGLMVHRREISLDLAYEFLGAAVPVAWHKLERFVQTQRDLSDNPRVLDYFQWLAERFEEYAPSTRVIHVEDRDWKP